MSSLYFNSTMLSKQTVVDWMHTVGALDDQHLHWETPVHSLNQTYHKSMTEAFIFIAPIHSQLHKTKNACQTDRLQQDLDPQLTKLHLDEVAKCVIHLHLFLCSNRQDWDRKLWLHGGRPVYQHRSGDCIHVLVENTLPGHF